MNIRQLEIFVAVAESGSMTQTASDMFVSQPAVSKAIRELEAALNLQLFDRVDNRLRLNPDGVLFRVKARQLLADYAALAHFGQVNKRRLPLRIGCSLTLAQATLPQAIVAFKQTHPEVDLRLYAENVAQIKMRLSRGDIDVAFIEGDAQNAAYDMVRLSTYALQVVAAPGVVSHAKLSIADLTSLPWLLRESGSTLRDTLQAALHPLGVKLSPWLESVNTTVLVNAAVAGLGLTVLPEVLAAPYLKHKMLVPLTLPQGIQMVTENYAITLKNSNRSALITDMIAGFKKDNSDHL